MCLDNIISQTDKYISLELETMNSFNNKSLFIHYILIRLWSDKYLLRWQALYRMAAL